MKDTVEPDSNAIREEKRNIYWTVPLAIAALIGASFAGDWPHNEKFNVPSIIDPNIAPPWYISIQYLPTYVKYYGKIKNGSYDFPVIKQNLMLDFGIYKRLAVGVKSSGLSVGPFVKWNIFNYGDFKNGLNYSYGWSPNTRSYSISLLNQMKLIEDLYIHVNANLGEQSERVFVYNDFNEEYKDVYSIDYHGYRPSVDVEGLYYQIPVGLTIQKRNWDYITYISYEDWYEVYSVKFNQMEKFENIEGYSPKSKLLIGFGIKYKFG